MIYMKIAVTSVDNQGLNSMIDSRFGRAPYFAIVDTSSMDINFIKNTASSAPHGAGVMATQTVTDQEVEAVISGNYGPKSYDGLKSAGIKLYSCKKMTIEKAVEKLKNKELNLITAPTRDGHGR